MEGFKQLLKLELWALIFMNLIIIIVIVVQQGWKIFSFRYHEKLLEKICKSVSKCHKKVRRNLIRNRRAWIVSKDFKKKAKKCHEIYLKLVKKRDLKKLRDSRFSQTGKKALLLQPYLMHLANNNLFLSYLLITATALLSPSKTPQSQSRRSIFVIFYSSLPIQYEPLSKFIMLNVSNV